MWNKDQPRFARVDTPCDSCVPHQGWISLLPKLGLVHFLWDQEGSWLFVCRFNEPIPHRKQLLIRIEEYLITCLQQSDQTMYKWGLEQCYCESPGMPGLFFLFVASLKLKRGALYFVNLEVCNKNCHALLYFFVGKFNQFWQTWTVLANSKYGWIAGQRAGPPGLTSHQSPIGRSLGQEYRSLVLTIYMWVAQRSILQVLYPYRLFLSRAIMLTCYANMPESNWKKYEASILTIWMTQITNICNWGDHIDHDDYSWTFYQAIEETASLWPGSGHEITFWGKKKRQKSFH